MDGGPGPSEGAESSRPDSPVGEEEEVARLEVAVQNLARVQVVQPEQRLQEVAPHVRLWQQRLPAQESERVRLSDPNVRLSDPNVRPS